jgi:pyruvate dehydrogenase E2 component (dihydrolipoamide acetyltransferase)
LVIERDVAAVAANAPKISPAARDALAKNPALTAPARGTGPDGLVLVEDLSEATASAPAAVDTTAAPARGSKTIPVKGIRKVIAERMHGSLSSTAQLTMNTSAKATALQAYRAKAKANAEALGLPNITINDMILFAVSRVLPRFPEMNAHFLGKTIEQFDAIHLGVAVDTDRGLLVPVLKDADLLSLAGISSTFKPIAKAAQAGTIEPELLSGSTFTVTNLGASGIESFTPVLNAPEVAILGVGGLTLRPYANKEGGVDHIPTLGLSLTIDHQGLDGGPAARFLQALVQALEDFELLLAN